MDKTLTEKDILLYREKYDADRENRVREHAVTSVGIGKAGLDLSCTRELEPVFSIDVDCGGVTNQKRSGRCWMFAGLNVLRKILIDALKVKDFECSQAYLQFYDKLEKANFFMEGILSLAKEDISSRNNVFLLDSGIGDGGHWAMFVNLVRKYGIVPSAVLPEMRSRNAPSTHTYPCVPCVSTAMMPSVLPERAVSVTFSLASAAGAQPARRQRHVQLHAELVVDRQHAAHIALRGDADLQLAGRFQRDAVLRRGIPHIQPVDGDGRILRALHLAQDALHLGKGDGVPARMGQKVLCLQPQGQRALRLAAPAEIVDQGLFLFVQLGHTGAPVRGRGRWRPPHCLQTFLQLQPLYPETRAGATGQQ